MGLFSGPTQGLTPKISFRQHKALELGKSGIDQSPLLVLVQVRIANCWRGGSGAAGIAQFLALNHVFVDVVLNEKPSTLVLRFVLTPHNFSGIGVFFQFAGKSFVREWLQLL